MAVYDWGHLCDYAFFDSGGKPCLIGLFQNIFTQRVPATHTRSSFVFSISGAKNERTRVRVKLVRPDGKDPLLDTGERDFNLGEAATMLQVFGMDNLLLPDFGPYEIGVFLDSKLSSTTTFHVVRPPESPRT